MHDISASIVLDLFSQRRSQIMSALPSAPTPLPVAVHDVREYFEQSVSTAVGRQKLAASDETVFYIVEMLAQFTRANALFECNSDGMFIKPLALVYADAVQAQSRSARQLALKRLGDVALLIAGMFSASLNRKLVGVDYYIAMGGSAYDFLASDMNGLSTTRALGVVFGELAAKFQAFVDVLAEVSDNSSLRAPTDILRLYENWAKTGSQRNAEQLRRLGIEPSAGSVSLRFN
jgi:hypothetical protein